jgi:aminopeptidase
MIAAPMPTIQSSAKAASSPSSISARLLGTVFKPTFGRKICILIDLPDLAEAKGYAFLKNPARAIQQRAHDHFYQGLKDGVADELALKGGEMYAYTQTTGSNLDLPDLCVDMSGKELSLERTSTRTTTSSSASPPSAPPRR